MPAMLCLLKHDLFELLKSGLNGPKFHPADR